MYQYDSFFDLSAWGQVGLIVISGALFVLMLGVVRVSLARQTVWVKLGGAAILFWMFVWMSPQVYYQYYVLIIPDLPLQWVIWPPSGPLEALQLLIFQGPQNLSAHSQGVLGWCMFATAFLSRRRLWSRFHKTT